jgi:hypothetical protein
MQNLSVDYVRKIESCRSFDGLYVKMYTVLTHSEFIYYLMQRRNISDWNTHCNTCQDICDLFTIYFMMTWNIMTEWLLDTLLQTACSGSEIQLFILCLWFRASLIFINNVQRDATHKAVYLLFCKFTLHISGTNHTHHQECKKL